MADLTPKMKAVLLAMDDIGDAAPPNQIGRLAVREYGYDMPNRYGRQHHGGTMGEGSFIAPILTALTKRELIGWGRRPDGLSGTAYRITREGREVAERLRGEA